MAALDILLLFDYHKDENLKTQACHLFFYPVLRKIHPLNSICEDNYLTVKCSSPGLPKHFLQ